MTLLVMLILIVASVAVWPMEIARYGSPFFWRIMLSEILFGAGCVLFYQVVFVK